MKNAFLVFVAVFALVALFAAGSNAQMTTTLMNNKTYANSQIDTSGSVDISGDIRDFLVLTSKDSMAADIYLDTKPPGSSTWTNQLTDSLVTTTSTGKVQEYVIRDFTVEKSPTAGVTRLRVAQRASGAGAIVAHLKYYAVIWRPR